MKYYCGKYNYTLGYLKEGSNRIYVNKPKNGTIYEVKIKGLGFIEHGLAEICNLRLLTKKIRKDHE